MDKPRLNKIKVHIDNLIGEEVFRVSRKGTFPRMSEMMYDVLEKVELEDETLVEVLQFSELNGSADVSVANTLYFASNSVMRLKMIRITLYNSFARIEPVSLYFMKGNLENKTSTGGGILKGLGRKVLSRESLFIN